MNKQTGADVMREDVTRSACERGDALVAYLYNEASAEEASDFERHAQLCAACYDELAALGALRTSIKEWRDQLLTNFESASPAASIEEAAPALYREASSSKRPSVLSVIREFFRLSPLWMRGATALATLALFALAAVGVMRLIQGPRTVVVETVKNVPAKAEDTSQKEVEAQVSERVRQEMARIEEQRQSSTTSESSAKDSSKSSARRNKQSSSGQLARRQRQKSVDDSRLQQRKEVQELLDDLQLTASNEDENLPRLSDLLGDNN